VPSACAELAEVTAREHSNIHRSGDLGAPALVRLLTRCDALRKPQRFADILLACECDVRGRLHHHDSPYPQRARLLRVLALMQQVDNAALAQQAQRDGASGVQVGQRIEQARVAAVQAALA